jgi:hypothetical protein
MVTCVPFGQASARCAVPSFDLSGPLPSSSRRLLCDGLYLQELFGPLLGSNPRRLARNCEMRRFICELMQAEVDRAERCQRSLWFTAFGMCYLTSSKA